MTRTRTQLRDSLRNLTEIIDKYENGFRPDFLQGDYSDWIADYKDITLWTIGKKMGSSVWLVG